MEQRGSLVAANWNVEYKPWVGLFFMTTTVCRVCCVVSFALDICVPFILATQHCLAPGVLRYRAGAPCHLSMDLLVSLLDV